MQPKMKYYLLMSLALVIGFGGFIVLVLVILPNLEKGSIWMPLLVLAWALVISFLLVWRYRVGKSDPEIVAQNKKDAMEFSRQEDDKMSKRSSRRRNRGAYGGELGPLVDRDEDEEEDTEETPADQE